jgi:3-methyladenine DNA glycosylase Tag
VIQKGEEMEAPEKISPKGLSDYLEVMTKAVFQSGMSWQVVESKWDGFRAAFSGFDPEVVGGLNPDEIDRIAGDKRIIRNRRKIEATVHNAATLVRLDEDHGGLSNWLTSLGDFESKCAGLRKEFKFLGDFGAYYFLYVVGEEVPPHDEWRASRGR